MEKKPIEPGLMPIFLAGLGASPGSPIQINRLIGCPHFGWVNFRCSFLMKLIEPGLAPRPAR